MGTAFKPWKIPIELRGNNENTVAKLQLVDPDEQIGIIDSSIRLTRHAYPVFGKILLKEIIKYPNGADFRYINSALKRAAELAIAKTINKHPELSAAWRTPTQDSLYSHGYRIRKLKIMESKSEEEIKLLAVTPQAFLYSTVLVEPRNILVDNNNPFSIKVRALGDLNIVNHVLLPAEWNMNNLRIVRIYDDYDEHVARYELRCSQFLSSRALITAPKIVNTVRYANYDGTYTGGR